MAFMVQNLCNANQVHVRSVTQPLHGNFASSLNAKKVFEHRWYAPCCREVSSHGSAKFSNIAESHCCAIVMRVPLDCKNYRQNVFEVNLEYQLQEETNMTLAKFVEK